MMAATKSDKSLPQVSPDAACGFSKSSMPDPKEKFLGPIVTDQLSGIGYLQGVTYEHDRSH